MNSVVCRCLLAKVAQCVSYGSNYFHKCEFSRLTWKDIVDASFEHGILRRRFKEVMQILSLYGSYSSTKSDYLRRLERYNAFTFDDPDTPHQKQAREILSYLQEHPNEKGVDNLHRHSLYNGLVATIEDLNNYIKNIDNTDNTDNINNAAEESFFGAENILYKCDACQRYFKRVEEAKHV